MNGPRDPIAYGTERDRLADEIERTRMIWHDARARADAAVHAARDAFRAEAEAAIAHRAALAAYEAHR